MRTVIATVFSVALVLAIMAPGRSDTASPDKKASCQQQATVVGVSTTKPVPPSARLTPLTDEQMRKVDGEWNWKIAKKAAKVGWKFAGWLQTGDPAFGSTDG